MIINDKLWERCKIIRCETQNEFPNIHLVLQSSLLCGLKGFSKCSVTYINFGIKGYFEEAGNHTLQYVFALNLW